MGPSFSVFVPCVPSSRLRAEVAARLEKVLDGPADSAALQRALAEGDVRLVDNLDEPAARAVATMLARLHVQGVRIEPARAPARGWTWLPGYAPVLLGLLVGAFTSLPLVYGLLGGAALSSVALLAHARRARVARRAFAAPVIAGSLPGWNASAKILPTLLQALGPSAREPLARLATATAFILDEVADYDSRLGRAAMAMLEAGIAVARGLTETATPTERGTEALQRLAQIARAARAELEGLSNTAGGEGHGAIAQKLEQAAHAGLPACT